MKIVLIGGDERMRFAARGLSEMGYEARLAQKCPEEYVDVVLVRDETMIEGPNCALTIVQRGTGAREMTAYLEEDEDFLVDNAILTAEGALHAAMGIDGRALHGLNCLVIGYGRIGRALYGMLESVGANVLAAVRLGKSMEKAKSDGARVMNMEEMREKIGIFDRIWNTVPQNVLAACELAAMRKGCALFDLASPPYGFDLETARSMDIWAERLSGLPGKYCPVSAGEIMAKTINNIVKKKGE